MVRAAILVATAMVALRAQPLPLSDILSRVSEEAEVFRQLASQTLTQETLEQRALKPPPRFHPRLGAAAAEQPKPQYQTREIVSEYSFSSLKDAPDQIHEFRQVVSVDGRKISTPEKARHAVSMGLKSEDDRARKRMLEDFQRYGLNGATLDFGQIILLFTKRQLHNYDFRVTGEDRLGADEATMLSYEQRQGPDNFRAFEGRNTVSAPIKGQLWVRKADGLPLRISMLSEWKEQKHMRRYEAVVEYVMTPFGMLAPVSVKYSETADDQLFTEDVFRYAPFKKFGADAEIKFDVLGEPEKK